MNFVKCGIAAIAALPTILIASANAQSTPAGGAIEQVTVTGNFYKSGSASAMKMNIPLLDTPFTARSYSNDFVNSLDTTSVDQLYDYMTGVTRAGQGGYDISIRGFKSSNKNINAVMVDGMPGLTSLFASPPTVGIDRIDVVQGPMSVLYGEMEPGGFVNLISKKPQASAQTTVTVKGQTYAGNSLDAFGTNGYTLDLDSTGALDADEQFLYRVVGEYRNDVGFRTDTYEHDRYIAPSLTWNIDDRTSLTGIAEYRDIRDSFDNGLAVPDRNINLIAPITTRYQEPEDYQHEKGLTGSLFFMHTFANNWQFNTSYRYVNYSSDQAEYDSRGVLSDNRTMARRAREYDAGRHTSYIDSNLLMLFGTGPVQHRLLMGVNAGETTEIQNRLKWVNSKCPGPYCFNIDLYNPIYHLVPPVSQLPDINPLRPQDSSLLTDKKFTTNVEAVYFSDLISYGEHWKLAFAGRAFHQIDGIEELRVPNIPSQNKKTSSTFIPSVGLMYQPTKRWTVYASYSESYTPADPGAKDENGLNPFQPVTAKQYEVGAKTQGLLDGRVTATLSLFQIEEANLLNTYSCPLGVCDQQVGAARSRGVEFETDITPLPGWQVLLGYSYLDAIVTADNDPVTVGSRLANTAANSASLWTRYDWQNGFGIGLGVNYTGDRAGFVPNSKNRNPFDLPGYTVADLGLYYTADRYSINLKFGNIFDKTYIKSTGNTADSQLTPGAPRNIILSISANL